MSRKMVKLIHADSFFPGNDVINLRNLAKNLPFEGKPYGYEASNFNLIFPDSEIFLYHVLGERVTVDPERSGVIRKPNNNAIHYEHFDSTEEWCFIVALEPTEINFWHHIDPQLQLGDLSKPNGYDATQEVHYDYNNLFEWKIHTNILLETNQCLFFRPWVFHSLYDGLIQYYRLIADSQFRILVMGMPNSSRASIAHKLSQKIGNDATLLRSFDIRKNNFDVDFTVDGQLRHCYRMLNLARASKSLITIIDMTCPLIKMRQILNADIVVWVSDNPVSKYEDLNKMFEVPFLYDLECQDDSDHTINNIIKKIMTKRL
jgi:hypothetical protein